MVKRVFKLILPGFLKKSYSDFRKQIRNFQILAIDYGQFKTIKNWVCEDKEGNPIPWFTYPAIEYLNHIDFKNFTVFEFGSGYSTLWWLKRAKQVISVEHNKEWYEKISAKIPKDANHFYHLIEEEEKYPLIINTYQQQFDIIVIDGILRPLCTKYIVEHIKKWGGANDYL